MEMLSALGVDRLVKHDRLTKLEEDRLPDTGFRLFGEHLTLYWNDLR